MLERRTIKTLRSQGSISLGMGLGYYSHLTGLISGPVIMSAGPWKPIRLEIYQSRIEELHFPAIISKDMSSARLDFTITIESAPTNGRVNVTMYHPDGSPESRAVNLINSTAKGEFHINQPKLWYPNGYGSQPLYQVAVQLFQKDVLLDSKRQNFGLRRAHVLQQPLPTVPGSTFVFEVNNIPIFCGGSNWIPADSVLTRLDPAKYRAWLTLLIKGNQNMVRVWGGGIYENDSFYEIADELGILVWQDFMFACGQYPCHKSFRESVEREVITQVKRLRKHPCIVIFAGNNEDYQVAEANGLEWDPSDDDPDHWLNTNFPARYLYEKLLPDLVAAHAPGVFYHPGSPWGKGKPTADTTVGDIHQWNGKSFD